jgi:FtsZ-binding cell division protein ZapB
MAMPEDERIESLVHTIRRLQEQIDRNTAGTGAASQMYFSLAMRVEALERENQQLRNLVDHVCVTMTFGDGFSSRVSEDVN